MGDLYCGYWLRYLEIPCIYYLFGDLFRRVAEPR